MSDELSDMTRELWRDMDEGMTDAFSEGVSRTVKESGADVIEAIKKQQKGNKRKTKPAAESK